MRYRRETLCAPLMINSFKIRKILSHKNKISCKKGIDNAESLCYYIARERENKKPLGR